MRAINILGADGAESGTISILDGSYEIEVPDVRLAEKIREIATRPLPYLKDESPDEKAERTVKAVARPGTEEHLKVLIFELRRIGLESRVIE